MKRIRQAVIDLGEYRVAQQAVVKLNQNESPYDVPEELKREVMERLEETGWNRYPLARPTRLLETISKYTGHPSSGIIVGNGSNEMIQTIFTAVCGPGDVVVLTDPGFVVYERLCRLMDLAVVKVPLLDDFSFDISSIIEKAQNARMITLASPNNPTGTAMGIDETEEIAREFNGIIVVDEAYHEFSGSTALGLLESHDNIIILRTFSKAFGLANLRLGYMLSRPDLIKELDKARLPFSVGTFQQIAGEILMSNPDRMQRTIDTIITERDRMLDELESIRDIDPVRSCTNFILFGIKDRTAQEIHNALQNKGVLVRYFGTGRLVNMLRVTVGTPEENDTFLKELRTIMEG